MGKQKESLSFLIYERVAELAVQLEQIEGGRRSACVAKSNRKGGSKTPQSLWLSKRVGVYHKRKEGEKLWQRAFGSEKS